jgi:hypothetical protein
MPQKTNLNVSPYFDDFNSDSDYYKVLFKPGFPIQARELNSLQTMLQGQIENFADHFFKDGAVVIPGGITYDEDYYAVKINANFLGLSVSTYIDQFVGKRIRGQNSQVTATVSKILSANDSETGDLTIYVKYLNSAITQEFTAFEDGELLIADETVIYGNTTIDAGSSFSQVIPQNATAIGSAINIDDGIYFVRGYFARVEKQSILLDQYSNTPTYRVGLNIIETSVNSSEDTSLYDNARGFNNFSAPGADRFKFELKLVKKDIDDIDDKTFVELLRIIDGEIVKLQRKNEYDHLRDYFAKRTFEESGDYVVTPFNFNVEESLNDEQNNNGIFGSDQITRDGAIPSEDIACLQIGPGKAYVKGYDVQVTGTKIIDLPKPRDTNNVPTSLVPFSMGNVLRVNNVFGTPVIGLNKDSTHVVELYAQRTGSNTAGTGEKIGEARVYSFGVTDDSYKDDATLWDLRLFDIQTYTQFTLNQQYSFSKGTYFKGLSSGAIGYAAEAYSSGNTVTLHQVAGKFQEGEQISIDGITEYNRSIRDIKTYSLNDVKSVYQDASTLGLASDFVADVSLITRVANGFGITDKIQITSGGSVTSAGRKFTGIATNTIIQYQNPAHTDVSYNRVTEVSSDGNTMTVVSVPNISSVNKGSLPGSTIEVDFRATSAEFIFGDTQGSLVVPLSNRNIASVNLSKANFPIYKQIDSLSTDAFGKLTTTVDAISGITSSVFETFDSERYSLHYSDGSIENLTGDQFTIGSDGNSITIEGLTANQSNVTLITTIKKQGLRSKVKIYTRSTKVTIDKSKFRTSGISSNTSNGLDFNSFYGLRVEDEEISLNRPDVVKVLGIFESTNSADPVLDKLTFESGITLNTNSVLGEKISGPNNRALAQIVTRLSSTEVEVVYLNEDRFTPGEQITFEESGIVAGLQGITGGLYIDRTDEFTMDKGQRPDIYDYSRIVRNRGSAEPAKRLTVIYDHYTIADTDEGDAFTVLSYSGDRYTKDVPSLQLPSGDSRSGVEVRVTDTIDFRPRVSNFTSTTSSPFDYDSRDFSTTGSTTTVVPKPDESTLISYDYYLPRMDRLILTKEGVFKVIQGTSADKPSVPFIVEPSMTLGTIVYPAYLYDVSDVRIIQVDNRRYTMRDIGIIEDRVQNLEEVSSLSLLELETRSLQITDKDGLDRFKTGFFVDDFTSSNFLDLAQTTCQVDLGIDHLSTPTDRLTFTPQLAPDVVPQAKAFNFGSDYTLLDGNLRKTGNVVSIDYKEILATQQPFATRTENVNPFNIIEWVGSITLEPARDSWTTNLTNTNKNTVERFQTINTGRTIRTVGDVSIGNGGPAGGRVAGITRTQSSSSQTNSWQTRALTNIDASIDINETQDPFMRSRNVEFKSEGLKPFTRYYAFMDGSNRLDVIPKLLEVNNVNGSFQVGETVDGFNTNGIRIITFRICTPNHKNGPFDAPTTTFDVNPYDRELSLSNSESYNASSTYLNIDTESLAIAQQGSFFGRLVADMTFIGQTSNAQADLNFVRLVSDSFGSVYGSFFFRDPSGSPRFRTGTRAFKLTTSPTDATSIVGDLTNSDAEAPFTGTGITRRTTLNLQQTAMTTTRRDTTTTITNNLQFRFAPPPPPVIIRRTIDRTRTINRTIIRRVERRDPLAQTFLTDNKGYFLTSVDIYMFTKDERTPLTVEIRTVELGTPTLFLASEESQIVLQPSQVNVSDDGSVATRVTFKSPVPLLPETEYAIVLLSPTSDNYTAWIARLGERTVNTAELPGPESVLYTQQYGAGSLFKSQNGSTWTPTQFEDLKFTVNKCEFAHRTGTATFFNPDISFDSDILPLLPNNPIKSLPRKLKVGITTVETTDMQEILTPGRKVGYGETGSEAALTAFIENVGGPVANLAVSLVGTGYSNGTYNNVNFFSLTGSGSGAVGVVTISSSGLSAVSITTPGEGFLVGETLGIQTSDVTKGIGANFTVTNITGYDTLYTTNVQGENFSQDDPLVYYDGATKVSVGDTVIRSSTLTSQIYSGNIIEVLHPSHGMHGITNTIDIKNIFPTTSPTTLSADITATDNTISIANTSVFATSLGVSTDAGFALIGNEVVYYNSIGSGTLGISTRGAEGSSSARHTNGTEIRPYEFNGMSLVSINNQIDMPSDTTLQANKGIDTYYLEIDRRDRQTGENQVNFTDERVAGGKNVWVSRNLQFDRITPRFDIVTPNDTTTQSRIRTISGRSAGGTETSFEDLGFTTSELNSTLLYPTPRLVASKVNETKHLDGLPRNKSLTIEVDLVSEDPNYSPFIYLDNCSIDIDRSRLNKPVDDYTTDGRVNSINQDPHSSIYVSQRVNLQNSSTSLKVLTSAYIDSTADMRVLYRLFLPDSADVEPTYELFPGFDNMNDTDDDGFGDSIINPAKNSGKSDAFVSPSAFDQFKEYQFTSKDLPPFTGYQIKIVFSGTNESYAPRLNDIRAIALA